MKVIMLTGRPNTGKTWTLKNLYKKLTGKDLDGSASVLDPEKSINDDRIIVGKDILLPTTCLDSSGDWECYIEWRGEKVGIVTMGDYPTSIIWHLGLYTGRGADILVIADSMTALPYSILNRQRIEYYQIKKTSIQETGIEDIIIKKMEFILSL